MATSMLPISDACLRKRCQEFSLVWNAEDWTTVNTAKVDPTTSVSYLSVPPICWLQVSCEIDVSYEWFKLAKRPEFSSRHPEIADSIFVFELVEHFAPGDALMRMLCLNKTNSMAAVVGSNGSGWQQIRSTHLNNFPCEGMYSGVMVPSGSESIDMGGGVVYSATFMTLEPGRDQTSTIVNFSFKCPWAEYPEWFTPISASLVEMMRQKAATLNKVKSHLLPIAQDFYTILTLRGCSRGLPLLPQATVCPISTSVQIGGFFWQPLQADGFSLPSYMQNFLRRAGLEAKVFHTMYGERLMPYQAIVLTEDWERIRDRFQEIFKAQCSAYRLLNGGSGAPKLRSDVGPRFSSDSTASSEEAEDCIIVAEENKTFLQLREVRESWPATRLPRKAAEYP
mmetsp:Transcript_66618/g.168826  ORF Transcript_66618/g.168826 Transcript_66618/m.168826 type:complete len:395 (-) Transcript_66618:73-1257(-)